jgi:hypothetical protein
MQSFDTAVFRCRSQQNTRLLTIPRNAGAREVKLRERNLCRTIARPYRKPELSRKSAAASARMCIRKMLSAVLAIRQARFRGIHCPLGCLSGGDGARLI